MIKPRIDVNTIIELDGMLHHLDGGELRMIEDADEVQGDKWLVTDLQEALSGFMNVEGPVKYAELMVRRKLQESGEFEEPVQVITHWKKRRSKNITDIFYTAVPSRLARYYFDALREQSDIALVFSLYGVLWGVLRRMRSKKPVAVVFRHNRFAELLIGARNRVYFANRCVAFDTQPEQIETLWQTIQADIASVERESRIKVSQIIGLNWIDAQETPALSKDWQDRFITFEQTLLTCSAKQRQASWPNAVWAQSAATSASPPIEKVCYYTLRSAPLVNLGLLAGIFLLIGSWFHSQVLADRLDVELVSVRKQIRQLNLKQPVQQASLDFPDLLKFVQKVDQNRDIPAYRQIIGDLTRTAFDALQLQYLTVTFSSGQVQMNMFGKVEAPFDRAHSGYQVFLRKLEQMGYQIEESKFETQISQSEITLKLSRPVT